MSEQNEQWIQAQTLILREQVQAGKTIAEARMKKGLSSIKLAEIVGCSRNYISEIQNGKKPPSPSTLLKICQALNLDELDMFRRYGRMHPDLLEAMRSDEELARYVLERRKALQKAEL